MNFEHSSFYYDLDEHDGGQVEKASKMAWS